MTKEDLLKNLSEQLDMFPVEEQHGFAGAILSVAYWNTKDFPDAPELQYKVCAAIDSRFSQAIAGPLAQSIMVHTLHHVIDHVAVKRPKDI